MHQLPIEQQVLAVIQIAVLLALSFKAVVERPL